MPWRRAFGWCIRTTTSCWNGRCRSTTRSMPTASSVWKPAGADADAANCTVIQSPRMDLSYPPAVRESIDRVGQALADVSVKDELEACERDAELWNKRDTRKYEPASSPLAQVAEFRALGFYALPLPELLTKARRAYVPLPGKWSAGGAVALGWPDPSGPWAPGDSLSLELDSAGKL